MKEMKFRHELKYYISHQDYHTLRNILKQFMGIDQNAALNHSNGYHIRSLYLDDCKNSALWEKLSGVSVRQKYRVRIYNFSDEIIMLEKKYKQKEMTAKTRQEITKEECQGILSEDFSQFIDSNKPLLRELYIKNRADLLRPVVLVDYEREAFVNPVGNVRVTFDKKLKTGLLAKDLFNTALPTLNAADENVVIMEVKYDEFLPDYIKRAVQIKNRQRQSVSKYVMCRKYTNLYQWEDQ